MVRTACAGGGLTFGMEETFMPHVERGNLRLSLETFCPRFPGFYIYSPIVETYRRKLRNRLITCGIAPPQTSNDALPSAGPKCGCWRQQRAKSLSAVLSNSPS